MVQSMLEKFGYRDIVTKDKLFCFFLKDLTRTLLHI